MHPYQLGPGSTINLDAWDPNETAHFDGDKGEAKDALKELNQRLEALQELLHAEHKHKILLVLQAMDSGGKDGTIRHVFEGDWRILAIHVYQFIHILSGITLVHCSTDCIGSSAVPGPGIRHQK